MSTALPRLNRALLDTIRGERANVVNVPDDALLDLPERAVQFGTGALLRGFVDDFLHRANQQGKFAGRIVAIASTGSVRDRALNDQDGLYTLVVEGIDKFLLIIGVIPTPPAISTMPAASGPLKVKVPAGPKTSMKLPAPTWSCKNVEPTPCASRFTVISTKRVWLGEDAMV